jgi:tartronate-semialdehyde synthase
MARMTAAEAAVAVLEREGVTCAFGLPGAAINPFYAAMRRRGGIRHVLARHVEGASHMAEGYTRARAGNIGVCLGTSGPAGTDMLTGLYSASADSIPILCVTGQAPVSRLHKEDFQAVDIAAMAKPVTKLAMTVLEAAQVPGAFAQAFHLMRSGRPGPTSRWPPTGRPPPGPRSSGPWTCSRRPSGRCWWPGAGSSTPTRPACWCPSPSWSGCR